MATTFRPANTSLETELLSSGHDFSFFQALRLLQMLCADRSASATVRVRPALDLSFPPADVQKVEKHPVGYSITASFLGLYGQASPVPTFYTEELLADSALDNSATKDFLDAINHLIFDLFHRSTLKYRLFLQIAEQEREDCLERLFCLIGLGNDGMRRQLHEPQRLLRHAGLLTLRQRSALGLQAFLSDALQLPVQLVQCVPRRAAICEEQRTRIGIAGCCLGGDAILGSEVVDRAGLLLRVGPLKREEFEAYLPGTPGRFQLATLVRFYLREPLAWELELIQLAGEVPAAGFGDASGQLLGWNTWLAPCREHPDAAVRFPQAFEEQARSNGPLFITSSHVSSLPPGSGLPS